MEILLYLGEIRRTVFWLDPDSAFETCNGWDTFPTWLDFISGQSHCVPAIYKNWPILCVKQLHLINLMCKNNVTADRCCKFCFKV